jgi:hypothetical protein
VNEIEEDLRVTLARHAHDAPPAGTPLLDAVRARSRKHAVRRRASVFGVAAAVAGITLATVPLATGSHGGASPPGRTGTPTATSLAPAPGDPATTVPFRATFIPPGWHPQVWPQVLGGQASLRLESPDPDNRVWIYTRSTSQAVHAEPLTVTRDVGATRIVVTADRPLPGDLLKRIAVGVQLAPAQTPVRFPYRLSYLPPNLHIVVAAATISHGAPTGSPGSHAPGTPAHVALPLVGSGLGFATPTGSQTRPALDIDISPIDPAVDRADTVFAGHPAHLVNNGDAVQVFGFYRYEVVTFASQDPVITKQELERVVRGFRPIADITDWDNWIADPLPR